MSPETVLLDRIEEEKAARLPVFGRKSFALMAENAVNLKEDTTLSRVGAPPLGTRRRSSAFVEEEERKQADDTVWIAFEKGSAVSESRTPMRGSLEALSAVRSSGAGADWVEAAAILKRDVVALRDTSYSRHAAVLLALADALTFTEPAEVSAAEGVQPLFSHALGLLSEPYISETSEEEFLGQLLGAGWNLAPSAGQVRESGD
jgi:hypothetical protein